MNALIVEDSRLARQELKRLLAPFQKVTVVGEAANADEAERLIAEKRPDLLFLDIQMPGRNGFELLAALETAPDVIFTTAYDQYALQAFEYNALDYLQKPLQAERLRQAIDKVEQRLSAAVRPRPAAHDQLGEGSQIFVQDGDRCWFVRLGDVRLFEVEGSYTRLLFGSDRPLVPKSLNALETRLDPNVFFRANRQQIANLRWVQSVEPWFSGGLKLRLRGGEEVEVSRRQAARFKELSSL